MSMTFVFEVSLALYVPNRCLILIACHPCSLASLPVLVEPHWTYCPTDLATALGVSSMPDRTT